MIWSHVAHLYMESFQRARRSRLDVPFKPLAVRTLAEEPMDLPGWRLDHLVRMTDSAGILQHASYTIPNFAEGYCTDDNARALLLTLLLEQLGMSSAQIHRLASTYSAFLNYAFDRDQRAVPQLHELRPDAGSRRSARRTARAGRSGPWGPACTGRGGGTCNSGPRSSSTWPCRRCSRPTSPRAWAFGLLGVCHYLERLSGARPGQPDPRHPHRPADRVLREAPRPTTGAGSRSTSPTTTPGCRTP